MGWAHLSMCGGGSVNGASWATLKCWKHALELGLDEEGLKRCYIGALELDPDNAVAWVGLGMCGGGGGGGGEKLLGGGSYDEETCYIRALELNPDVSPVAWSNLGVLGGIVICIKGTSYDRKKRYIRALELDLEYVYAWNLDGPIRADRFADSRESLDSRESFQGSRTEPLFCESRFGGQAIGANRRVEAIRANRLHVMKIGVLLRIDSCESIRANRPDSRCESPGHLRPGIIWVLSVEGVSMAPATTRRSVISELSSSIPRARVSKTTCGASPRVAE